MLMKMTKMALVASLVVGAASAALAGDNSGEYSGGFVIPGSMNGVNPVNHHSSKASDLAPLTKLTPRVWRNGSQAYGIYPARTRSIGTMTGAAPMLCPLLEGYPNCR
jgi:hypothetical protein